MAMFTAQNVMITSTIWNLRRCQMLLHGVPQKALDVVSGMNLFMAYNGLIKLIHKIKPCRGSTLSKASRSKRQDLPKLELFLQNLVKIFLVL